MAAAQTLKSDTIHLGKTISLFIETVRLPDGHVVEREVIRHPGAVAMVPLHANGRVTFVRQFRLAAGRELLEIPAGTMEPGETPEVCATRELQEEAGLLPANLNSLGGIFAAPGYTSEYLHLFLATGLTPSRLQADADEFLEVVTLPFADALDLVRTGQIVDAKTISGLLLARRLLAAQGEP
ncbi:MAG: NUDIX hydrolase [Anaerolineae bacterium]|nr:NUDIX hydrolase [Anaerolineae bacterium]